MVTEPGKILIVDDDEDILLTLRLFLKQHFQYVQTENNPAHIPRALRQHDFDVILLDLNFRPGETSGKEGIQWLEKIISKQPEAQVIMITAYGDVSIAVNALKQGAADFIVKPWRNEKLLATIMSLYRLNKTQQKVEYLKHQRQILTSDLDNIFGTLVGQSQQMQQVFTTIKKVAITDANVLILGENGTGKELVARALHRKSERREQVFINVDLGAVAENLFESELFGHVKGAFTDAKTDRIGRFEAAHKGTLFLDEIGNLSLPLQAKLLAVLQNREITKVGSNKKISLDIRLICATNLDLYNMVKKGEFRQDLLYRINTVEMPLPPLREREEDIVILADHFLDLYKKKYQKPDLKIADDALGRMNTYPWPGNVRELRHLIERAVILSDGSTLSSKDFLFHEDDSDDPTLMNFNLREIEKWAIQQALKKHMGNISKTSNELGLTRAALYRRLEKYDL